MATIKAIDVWEGAEAVWDGGVLLELVRVALVEDLDPNASAALASAVGANNMPALWSEHPAYPDFRLANYQTTPRGPGLIEVRLRYVRPWAVRWSGSGALQETQTDMDKNGVPVTVINKLTKYPDEKEQAGVMVYLAPEQVLVASRIEPDDSIDSTKGIDPLVVSMTYTGKTNSEGWQSGEAGQWLCEAVHYNNEGLGGVAWNMTYEFRLKRGKTLTGAITGWDPEVVWIERRSGQPAPILDADGRKIVPRYEQVDFGKLGLI